METCKERVPLADVYKDIRSLVSAAEIIVAHSTNQKNIREIALDRADIGSCKAILDLGCAFGPFTLALKFCPACETFFYENPLPVVSAILESDRHVALVKRKNEPCKGEWCLPSGFAESGESIEDAALRELEEETLAMKDEGCEKK